MFESFGSFESFESFDSFESLDAFAEPFRFSLFCLNSVFRMMIGLFIDFFTLLNVDSWLGEDAWRWPDGESGFFDGEPVSSGIVSIASFSFSFMFSTEQFDALLQLLSLSFAMQSCSCESWLSCSPDASSRSDEPRCSPMLARSQSSGLLSSADDDVCEDWPLSLCLLVDGEDAFASGDKVKQLLHCFLSFRLPGQGEGEDS